MAALEDKDGPMWEEAEVLDKEKAMSRAREVLEVQVEEESAVVVKTEERAQSVQMEVAMVDVSTVAVEEPWKRPQGTPRPTPLFDWQI